METKRVLGLCEICEIQRHDCPLGILEIYPKKPKPWTAATLEGIVASCIAGPNSSSGVEHETQVDTTQARLWTRESHDPLLMTNILIGKACLQRERQTRKKET